jgi:hypothetical protein
MVHSTYIYSFTSPTHYVWNGTYRVTKKNFNLACSHDKRLTAGRDDGLNSCKIRNNLLLLLLSVVVVVVVVWRPWSQLSLYHKLVPGIFLGLKRGWCVKLTTSPPPGSRMYRKCGSLDVSQLLAPPRPIRRMALPFGSRSSVHSSMMHMLRHAKLKAKKERA